jgi:carbon starvation protein CstA
LWTNYTILDADKGKSLVIINGATAVTITIPVALQLKMQVGFIREDAGEVTLIAAGMTLKNAINGFRIKDRYDQAFIEQGISTKYYVFGTTKV